MYKYNSCKYWIANDIKTSPNFLPVCTLKIAREGQKRQRKHSPKGEEQTGWRHQKKKKGFANPQRTFGIYKQQHAYGTIFTALKHYATNNDKSANKTSMKKQLLKAASWYSFKTINHA